VIPALIKKTIDGQEHVFMNPAKDAVKPIFLSPDTTPLVLAANASRILSVTALPEENLRGDVELYKLLSIHTNPYTLDMTHLGINKKLSNQPIHVNCMAGSAQLPFVLFESMFLETNQSLQINFQDLGAGTTIRFNAYGRRFLAYDIPGLAKERILYEAYSRKTHPYWLTLDVPLTIPANGTATGTMTLTGEADLEVWKMLDAPTSQEYTVEIFEGRSGRPITDGPIHSANIFGRVGLAGSGQFPFVTIESWLLKRQTTLRLLFTDLSGVPNVVRPTLHGKLIYYQEIGQPPIQIMGRPSEGRRMATRGAGPPPGISPELLGPFGG